MRSLFKWSLQITGASIVGYHAFLTNEQQCKLKTSTKSMVNFCRASLAISNSFYQYYTQLKNVDPGSQQYKQIKSQVNRKVASRILNLCKQNKGIYIKLGMHISKLQHAIPQQFVSMLRKLKDQVQPLPYEELKIVLEKDFKKKPRQVFDLFQKQPVFATSTYQIHRAFLLENGYEVFVKVKYPSIKMQAQYDLKAIKYIGIMCQYLLNKYNNKDLNCKNIYKNLEKLAYQDMDFLIEVDNGINARQAFKDNNKLIIPKFNRKYCTDNVIVMEYIQSKKLLDKQGLLSLGLNLSQVCSNLSNLYSQMVYTYGYVNNFSNPQNIYVKKCKITNDCPYGFKFVFLNHNYLSLSEYRKNNLSKLWMNMLFSDQSKANIYAKNLGIQNGFEFLPILFLYRTSSNTKYIGANIKQQQLKYINENNHQFKQFVENLPEHITFILNSQKYIKSYCQKLSENKLRQRYMYNTYLCIKNQSPGYFLYSLSLIAFSIKLWIFENLYGLYKIMFGIKI